MYLKDVYCFRDFKTEPSNCMEYVIKALEPGKIQFSQPLLLEMTK